MLAVQWTDRRPVRYVSWLCDSWVRLKPSKLDKWFRKWMDISYLTLVFTLTFYFKLLLLKRQLL